MTNPHILIQFFSVSQWGFSPTFPGLHAVSVAEFWVAAIARFGSRQGKVG